MSRKGFLAGLASFISGILISLGLKRSAEHQRIVRAWRIVEYDLINLPPGSVKKDLNGRVAPATTGYNFKVIKVNFTTLKKSHLFFVEDNKMQCNHQDDAVKWNRFNQVLQCHVCGEQMEGPMLAMSDARRCAPVQPGEKNWVIKQEKAKLKKNYKA